MWSDELHKKMEEAENNSDSSNHEKAWEKMELLLDEHLPVKKKRRRFIFLLFPLLLGGGIALFFLQKKGNNDHSISQQENSTIQKPVSSSKTSVTPGPAEKISSDKNNDSAIASDDLTSSKAIPDNKLIIIRSVLATFVIGNLNNSTAAYIGDSATAYFNTG